MTQAELDALEPGTRVFIKWQGPMAGQGAYTVGSETAAEHLMKSPSLGYYLVRVYRGAYHLNQRVADLDVRLIASIKRV